ncbi:Hypothetical protein PFR_JS23-PH_5 [Propionibacterium freudenreichii]|uniref:Uncharacterized protein n=1 Tax=Propionibacterium freudenreichii TaxID=1744 RepID=A0A509MK73_9ACTN|nr:Hypothetical protein PFR_JS23-PH_5 [Propionibacterium freudenreichii]SUY93563.1 Hypothetical protein PFR_JS23-PH_5 [Propionibacterium freudenreichii]
MTTTSTRTPGMTTDVNGLAFAEGTAAEAHPGSVRLH